MITIIAAVGRNNELGRKGDLIWTLPGDLARFKRITMGHTVVMGRKTWESLPFKPLKGRRNIVVTGNPDYPAPGAEKASCIKEALAMTGKEEDIYIIGGATVYESFLAHADRLMLTEVDAEAGDADTFFPRVKPEEWEYSEADDETVEAGGLRFRYRTYMRK